MSSSRPSELPGVPAVESPLFDELFSPKSTDSETLRIAQSLHEQGFAIIEFPDAQIDARIERIKTSLNAHYDWNAWRTTGWTKNQGMRIQDAWAFNADVKTIATNEVVIDLLSRLYGRRAFPFQTLNFPVGTQQHYHSDALHFSSVPERFMCGVWLAFEDTDEENGPLIYYPGSHAWHIYSNEYVGRVAADTDSGRPTQSLYNSMWKALVRSSGLEPMAFRAKRGQALIWAANLLHGGAPQKDPSRTRWSQVTHYYFEDCIYS